MSQQVRSHLVQCKACQPAATPTLTHQLVSAVTFCVTGLAAQQVQCPCTRPRLAKMPAPVPRLQNCWAVQHVARQGMAQPFSPSVQMHASYHHWFAGAGKACSAGQSCEQAWWGGLAFWAGRSGAQVCTGSGSLHASHGGVHPLLFDLSFPGHMHILLSVLPSVLCYLGSSCTFLHCCAM